ncbi:hypothetical protein Tco_0024615 [Tanacetum coccineum]
MKTAERTAQKLPCVCDVLYCPACFFLDALFMVICQQNTTNVLPLIHVHLNDALVSLTYKPIDTPSVIVHFESTSGSDASASLTAGGDLGKCYSKESVPQQKDDEEIKMDDLIKLMPKPTQGMLGVALAVVVTDFEPLHSFGVLIRRLFPRVQRPKLLYSRTRQSDLKDYGKDRGLRSMKTAGKTAQKLLRMMHTAEVNREQWELPVTYSIFAQSLGE